VQQLLVLLLQCRGARWCCCCSKLPQQLKLLRLHQHWNELR
jgi:hypothetical protein